MTLRQPTDSHVMSEPQRTKILVVDDLQEKLLVYHTILESPDIEIVTASSGQGALARLLHDDFAVVLLDVNMPGMDGYETADMIRKRRRSAHTPIIFVTAYADEMHAIKGYSYGAVDYVLSPVIPDVLRTKVRVFTDLYRLNQQVREQAARQVEQSERERARLAAVLDRTSDVYVQADRAGRILRINAAGMVLLGVHDEALAPKTLADIHVTPEQQAAAQRDGAWFGEGSLQAINGELVAVSQLLLAHMQGNTVESLSLIAHDIRERRRAEQTQAHLAAIVESSDDAIISLTLDGLMTSWNSSAERLFGYTVDEVLGQPVTLLIPSERVNEEESILEEIRCGRRVAPFETVRLGKDGRPIDVSLTVSPLLDADGCVIGASKVARDISLRRQNEAELARYRSHLEELVVERTSALQKSHERLRLSDRLASIGTLAAGLGHDMGNLLLPIRARIASLEALNLPVSARDHVQAIKVAGEYLKRLSQGLRLFALDPTDASTGVATLVRSWWQDVEPFLRNAVPKTCIIEAAISDGVDAIAMPPHTFTQVIYNLVQNAGQCLADSTRGCVRIVIEPSEGSCVCVCVSDNGPGMTEDVRQRCMEPFFTTRTRGISTGLGLALVRGAVGNANGHIEIESSPGQGTTFRLTLPRAASVGSTAAAAHEPRVTGEAVVHLTDMRLAAYTTAFLRELGVTVQGWPASPHRSTRVLITDLAHESVDDVLALLHTHTECRAILLGHDLSIEHSQAICLPLHPAPPQLRAALQASVQRDARPMEFASR